MEVKIVPFAADKIYDFDSPASKSGGKRTGTNPDRSDHLNAAYWGIYLDDKRISLASSRESAEKVKLWVEAWLRDRTL